MRLGGESGCDHIGEITLKELCEGGYAFCIPSYQRGYRWQSDQVNALITDLTEFLSNTKGTSETYCLKAIVLKRLAEKEYRVVDGQQRLRTIQALLKEWRSPDVADPYVLRYEEDVKPGTFSIQCIENTGAVARARALEGKGIVLELSRIQFVWYIIDESLGDTEGYGTYQRLNANKIPLTGAELIRGLYLQSFCDEVSNVDILKLDEQIQIAAEWEQIERRLRDDRFWYMFNRKGSATYTKIDRLFEIVTGTEGCGDLKAAYLRLEADIASEVKKKKDECGDTFLPAHAAHAKSIVLRDTWRRLLRVYWFLERCYDDVTTYHYLGFCLKYCGCASIKNYFEDYQNKPFEFSQSLAEKIKRKINLRSISEVGYDDVKSKLEMIFVLFNIETLNTRAAIENGQGFRECERFPFARLYGTTWNIEHICSQTDNPMSGEYTEEQIEWALETLAEVCRHPVAFDADPIDNPSMTDAIRLWLSNSDPKKRAKVMRVAGDLKLQVDFETTDASQPPSFEDIYKRYYKYYASDIPEEERNFLSNLTLLDETTNKGYHNSIFPVKRRKIREADLEQGRFVPVCTRNVFMKFYTDAPTSLTDWQKADAVAYAGAIEKALEKFFL